MHLGGISAEDGTGKMPTGLEGKAALFDSFNGLRTDCLPSKCDPEHSPDCSDMVFSVGGMATRNAFRSVDTLSAWITYRKEFVGRDGALHVIFLLVDGSLWSQENGVLTQIDAVASGSQCNSVTAYGREYMSFFGGNGGTDAPRVWDGKILNRVSQGGPGLAPSVVCLSLPSVNLITGTSPTSVTISTVTPTDPQQVQIGGGGGPDDYEPPVYQTFYTTLTVVTTTAHGLSVGNVVSISGNTVWNVTVAYVSQIIDADTFKIAFQTQDSSVGTGGTVGISNPLLSRKNNEVQATTDTAHGLRVGFKAAISGVSDLSYSITSIQTSAANYPNEAEITFPASPGFVPGDTISIENVPYVDAGGGIQGYDIRDGIASVTTNAAHGLSVGLTVVVSLHTYAPRNVTVTSILSPTVWTYETNEPNVTDTGGYVHVPFPSDPGAQYTVAEVPTDTTVRIAFASSDFTWTGGNVAFPWNGSFYVDAVPTSTTFRYRQSGPDATLQTGGGTVTPQGQLSPGEHQVCEHYITQNGDITPPSPPYRFTVKVNQYPLVTLSKGPANIRARVLSFTAVNGGSFAMMLVPPRAGGIQVGTSTVIQDNTTPNAIVDFPDTALLSATRIDEPGNNLFECFPLTTPDGVSWYQDRLAWKGEKNVMLGMQNMAFDGGTPFSATTPNGWMVVESGGSVVQSGFMPVYQIAAGQTGNIQQPCVRRYDGGQIMLPATRYSLRFWVDGAHEGTLTATISSAATGFSTSAAVSMTARGYMAGDFAADTPASIPDDMVVTLYSASSDLIQIRDVQFVYRDNPNRWPSCVMSYTQQPGTYDFITGILGAEDDSTELRAMFKLEENFYHVTASGLYYAQSIGNTEPSSWGMQRLADNCPAFHANAVTTGNGWASWAGRNGVFWFSGGRPSDAGAIIQRTWAAVTSVTSMTNDPSVNAKRVYICTNNGLLVYDYRELDLGGMGKWCPWNRQIANVSSSVNYGMLFTHGLRTYRLDTVSGITDDDLGLIGGYYQFAPIGNENLYQKSLNYLFLRMYGAGTMTPFLSSKRTGETTDTCVAQVLDNLQDDVIEYPLNGWGFRLAFLKIGQEGMQFSLDEVQMQSLIDPNKPTSGVRR
jgi:hypothetical protein